MKMTSKYPEAAQSIRENISQDPWTWFELNHSADPVYLFKVVPAKFGYADEEPCVSVPDDDLRALYREITDGKTAEDFRP